MKLSSSGSGGGRRLPDTGPSAIRYLAAFSAATLAVLVTLTVTPSIGHSVRTSFCSAGDTACDRYAIASADLGQCRVISHADTVTDDAVVFTDDLGRSGALTLSRTVDKNAVVHWFVRTQGADGASGQLTEFASEDAAREYITAAQHQPVRERLAAADPTGLTGLLADTVDGHEIPAQSADASFLDGGSTLALADEARSGVTGARVGGGVTGIAEVKTTTGPEPASTVYLRLSSSTTEKLGLLRPEAGALPGTQVVAVASLAYDKTGRPEQLTIEAAGRLPQRLGPPFGTVGPSVMAGLLAPGPNLSPGLFTGRVSISVGLDDPARTALVADALHAAGIPVLLDRGADPARYARGPKPIRSFYRMLDRGADDASVTVNTYRSRLGENRPTVTFGLQGGLTVADALPDQDYYYAPGLGFVEWQRCG